MLFKTEIRKKLFWDRTKITIPAPEVTRAQRRVTAHPGPVMRETRSQPRAESEDIMNKLRRKQIAEAIILIEKAMDILEKVKDDEQEAFDNLPESLQGSERGETMEEYIYTLETFLDELDTCELQDIVDG